MKKYPIAVANGRNHIRHFRFRLHSFGLYYNHEDNAYKGNVSRRKMRKIEQYCNRKHLKFYIDNEYGKRSTNYRQTFFSGNSPAFGNHYFCAYCGSPVRADKITIDHLFPVGKVSKDLHLQKKMKLLGIPSVNSSRNLVPACGRCNRKKSTKMGIWIIRGFIGKFQFLWYLRWTVRILVVLLLLSLIPYTAFI